jgi:MYXO-CTERM domain-containing protein
MSRLLPVLVLSFGLLAPTLALADIPPSRGCSRCSVDDEGTVGLAALALIGAAAAVRLRRRAS